MERRIVKLRVRALSVSSVPLLADGTALYFGFRRKDVLWLMLEVMPE